MFESQPEVLEESSQPFPEGLDCIPVVLSLILLSLAISLNLDSLKYLFTSSIIPKWFIDFYSQLLQNAAQGQYAANMYGAGGVGGASGTAGTGGLNIVSPQSLGYNLGGPGGMSGHDYAWQVGQQWGAPGGASAGGAEESGDLDRHVTSG